MATTLVIGNKSYSSCEYANERWLGGKGWPADPAARAGTERVGADEA